MADLKNTTYRFKGILAGLLLIIAPIIGVLLRIQGSNGWVIGTVVAGLNIIIFIGLGFYLRKDFIPTEEKESEKGEKASSGKKKGDKEETTA
ncbi:MAG: hypothetical protein ACTSYF_18840 [Promethearchaeota archaeon]